MIARTAILTTVKVALEAAAGLAGVSVVIDTGNQRDEIEGDLNADGCVITLPPITGFDPRPGPSQMAGSIVGDSTFSVVVLINPHVNGQRVTQFDPESIRYAVTSAICGIAADDHGDRFKLLRDDLSDFDPGLISFIITFIKGSHVNAQ